MSTSADCELHLAEDPCRLLCCPHCGPKEAQRIIKHLVRQKHLFRDPVVLTLHLDPRGTAYADGRDQLAAYELVVKSEPFRKIASVRGVKLPYVRSLGLHSNGSLHLHHLLDIAPLVEKLGDRDAAMAEVTRRARKVWAEQDGFGRVFVPPDRQGYSRERAIAYVVNQLPRDVQRGRLPAWMLRSRKLRPLTASAEVGPLLAPSRQLKSGSEECSSQAAPRSYVESRPPRMAAEKMAACCTRTKVFRVYQASNGHPQFHFEGFLPIPVHELAALLLDAGMKVETSPRGASAVVGSTFERLTQLLGTALARAALVRRSRIAERLKGLYRGVAKLPRLREFPAG